MKREIKKKRDWPFICSASTFFVITIISLLANLIANDRPWYITTQDGKSYFPIVQSDRFWNDFDTSTITSQIRAPIKYRGQGYTALRERLAPPGSMGSTGKHLLGTDRLGRDIAAGLIYGWRKSIGIAVIAVLIACLLGLLLGVVAGYYENSLIIKWRWYYAFLGVIFLYLIYLGYYDLLSSFWVLAGAVVMFFVWWSLPGRPANFPFDLFVIKTIEILRSIPTLLILLVLLALIPGLKMWNLAIILGLLRWTSFARFSRGEVLKIKSRDYIKATKMSDVSDRRIITHYILPEAFGPLTVVFAFSFSSMILIESTLSFLSIGLPVDEVTLGTMLGQARQYPTAWWLAVFPGLCILVVLLSLNIMGDRLKRRFDVQE